MDQHNTPPPPPPRTNPTMATSGSGSFASSSLSPIRAPSSSAIVGRSSSAHSHRRFNPYPPQASLPGGSLATGSGSGSSSRLQQIPPPPARDGRRRNYELPTPFLSELISIRRASANLFANLYLGTGATTTTTQRISNTLHGQQTRPPSSSMSRLGTPSYTGSFSEFVAPPMSRQLQPPPPTGMPPMTTSTSPSFSQSGFGFAPSVSPSSGVPHQADGTFSGFRSPAAVQPEQAQRSSTDLAPLPSEIFSSGGHTETTTFGSSSSWSAQQAQPSLVSDPPRDVMSFWQPSGNDGTSGVMQPAASDLVASTQTLHTRPVFQVKEEPIEVAPCLDEPVFISLDDDDDDDGLSAIPRSFKSSSEPPSLPGLEPVSSEDRLQLGAGGSSSRPCTWDAGAAVESSQQRSEAAMTPVVVMYDKVSTGGSSSGGGNSIPWDWNSSMSMSQQEAPLQFQTSQSNTLAALFQQRPNPNLQMPLQPSLEDRQHFNSRDGGTIPMNCHTSILSQQQAPQQWQPTQNNTFVQQQQNNQQLPLLPFTDTLQLNSNSGGSNPWNCHDSMSMSQIRQQAPQLDEPFSMGFSNVTPQWQSPPNNTFTGLVQQQQNLQMPLLPSFTDNLHLNSTDGPGACSTTGTNSSEQAGWEAMPAPTTVSSKFDISNAGGNMLAIGQQGWPATPPAPCNNYSMFGTSGGSSSSSSVCASMPLNLSNLSMEYSNAMTNLRLDAMEKPSRLPPRQPSSLKVGAGASSSTSRRGAHGDLFSEVEMETINKDKLLKKIVSTDPQRVKRILNNRVSVAELMNARKINRALDLQSQSEALQMDSMPLSTQVLSHKATTANLNARNGEMRHKLNIMNEQASVNEALSGQLKSEIQSFRLLQLNRLRTNGKHDPMHNQMAGENGLYPLENSKMNNSSGLRQLPTQVRPPQHEQQPHQAIDDELVMDQQ